MRRQSDDDVAARIDLRSKRFLNCAKLNLGATYPVGFSICFLGLSSFSSPLLKATTEIYQKVIYICGCVIYICN